MPRFDYKSITTPGGIGDGISNLTSALVEAPNRRRQIEMQMAELEARKQDRDAQRGFQHQSLSRQLANDEETRGFRERDYSRQTANDAASQGFREREIAVREQEAIQRGLGESLKHAQNQPMLDARTDYYKAGAERARRPPAASRDPNEVTVSNRIALEKLAAEEAAQLDAAAAAAATQATKEWMLLPAATRGLPPGRPAGPSNNHNLVRRRLGLDKLGPVGGTPTQAPQGLPPAGAPPAPPAPNAAAPMRAHLTTLFKGSIPAGASKALQAAEQGSPGALDALMEKYGQPPGAAPLDSEDDDGRHLLGTP